VQIPDSDAITEITVIITITSLLVTVSLQREAVFDVVHYKLHNTQH